MADASSPGASSSGASSPGHGATVLESGGDGVTARLLTFIDASPSPFHAVESAAAMLQAAGAKEVSRLDRWDDTTGARFVVRDGAMVAWYQTEGLDPAAPLRLVGAHTDSPNLRIKPRPDTGQAGYRQLGVDVYGGALVNSWLDRDLGLSGRVSLVDGSARLIRVDRPLLRVAQLAIHLDRQVEEGLVLDRQRHLTPIWGLGVPRHGELRELLASELDIDASAVAAWDVMCHDLTPARLLGLTGELYAASRIDNLASCHAATEALTRVITGHEPDGVVPLVCLFDHEEVGSVSAAGAMGPLLGEVIERLVLARGGDREDVMRALAGSWMVSVDGAHAAHPNYLERFEPEHLVSLNGGPVIKSNANVRYASDAPGIAMFRAVCDKAGVPVQQYVHRSNLPCGSTIGPLTAANLGVATVDVGSPQLSMHSARELGGAADPPHLTAALTAFLAR
jgi:aspartyl aminopeptidase